MQRTLSIRIGQEDYDFVKQVAKEHDEEVSKTVRGLVDMGRLMLAIENYRKGRASIGKAAELAGVSISEMISILADFGIKSNLNYDDYLEGLENIKKGW